MIHGIFREITRLGLLEILRKEVELVKTLLEFWVCVFLVFDFFFTCGRLSWQCGWHFLN